MTGKNLNRIFPSYTKGCGLCDQVVSCSDYQRQVSSNKTKDAPTVKRPPSASLHGAKKSRGLFAKVPVLWLVVPTIVMTTLAFVVVFTER